MTTVIGGVILAFYIATWAIVTGALRIAMAIRLRKEIEGEWLLVLSGAVSILFGVAMMARPSDGVIALLYFIAVWAILLGVILIAFAWKARSFGNKVRDVVSNVREIKS